MRKPYSLINKWKFKKVREHFLYDFELKGHIEHGIQGIYTNLFQLFSDKDINEEEYLFLLVLVDFYELDLFSTYSVVFEDGVILLSGKKNNYYVDESGLINKEDLYSIFIDKDEISVNVVYFESYENKKIGDNINTIKEFIRKRYGKNNSSS